MKTKTLSIVFIVLFFVIIITPILLIDISPKKVSEMENRYLADFPSLNNYNDLTAYDKAERFAADFETFLKDRIGFRENAVVAYKAVTALWPSVKYADGQYVLLHGLNGHDYFAGKGGYLIEKFQGTPIISDKELQTLAEKLNEITAYLSKQNIPMLVIFCPDKESVYPEYYPTQFIKGEDPIPLDIVTDYLNRNLTVNVYNIKKELIAEKANYPVYNRAEGDLSHYNAIGGFIEYQVLVEHLRAFFPEIKELTFDDISIVFDESNVPEVSVINSCAEKLGADFFDGVDIIRIADGTSAYKNDDADLSTILFIGDSYFNKFGSYVSYDFRNTIGIHYMNITYFKEYVEQYKPDVVVFEAAEREIGGFAYHINSYDVEP